MGKEKKPRRFKLVFWLGDRMIPLDSLGAELDFANIQLSAAFSARQAVGAGPGK